MLITKVSPFSGNEHTRDIPVTAEQLKQWREGSTPIQTALPHLSAEDREFPMTGITPEEWYELFGEG